MELEAQIAALSARVAELEQQVAALSHPATETSPAPSLRSVDPPPPPPPPPPPGTPGSPGLPPATPAQAVPATRPEWLNTETMLKWAGILLVVLAAVFFVGTAISRGWIGPELQLAGATAGGLALIAGGFHLIDRNRPWAAALATGGALVVSICAAAANAGLDVIGDYPALITLAIVTVGLAEVSRRLSVQSVVTVAGLAAVILPLWILTDIDPPPAVLASWMAILVVAASGFAWFQGWAVSRLLTVVAGALVLAALIASETDRLETGQRVMAVAVIAVVAAFAWAGPVVGEWIGRAGVGPMWQGVDHRAVLSVPVWAWAAAIMAADVDTGRAVAFTGFTLAAIFVVVALAAWSSLPATIAASHLLGAGILVSISMAILTDGPGLLVGLAAQAAATAVIARRLHDPWLLGLAAVTGAVAVGWAARSTAVGLFDELSLGQLLANLFVVTLLVGWAALAWWRGHDDLAGPLAVVGWIGVLGWIASAVGHQPQGQVVVSLLWSMLAAAALITGVRAGNQLARVVGIATLGVVLVKLLTVDLAEVDTLWRVGLFLVVGTGLLRLGYVLPRLSSADDRQTPEP